MTDPSTGPQDRCTVGVDLGGTNIQSGVIDPSGRIIGRDKRKTEADAGPDGVIDRLVGSVRAACKEAGVEPDELGALGVGAPGPVDAGAGVVIEAVNLCWVNLPLASIIRERLGVPVGLSNDANAGLVAEHRLGAARGADHALGVWVGTGVGGALVIDGKLHTGAYHTAGEIGHVLTDPWAPPGSRSLEHACSRTAIVDRLRQLMRANHASSLTEITGGRLHKIKSRHLLEAYTSGDTLVVEVIDDAAYRLGVAIAGFVTMLSLECVVLGGGLTEALGELLVATVRRGVQNAAFPEVCRNVRVIESALGDDAGILGAALLGADRAAMG
ncbi:MAG: ROK family protein [Phycisphaerales bacterium JB059]